MAGETACRRIKTPDWTVWVYYSPDHKRVGELLPNPTLRERLGAIPASILHQVTLQVRVVIKTNRQISARFTTAEILELFRGEWPNRNNFDRIFRAVNERARYPMPESEMQGGIKSLDAQGQTKKPGSHSHDKHR